MKTALTQKDVYTPAEANAFHEGFTDATVNRFRGEATEITDAIAEMVVANSDSILTPAEANAYFEGVEAGKAKFGGIAYVATSAE